MHNWVKIFLKNKSWMIGLTASILLSACHVKNDKQEFQTNKVVTEDEEEIASEKKEMKEHVEYVDGLLNRVEDIINRMSVIDEESDEYDRLDEKVLDLYDELDSLYLTPEQGVRAEILFDLYCDV